MSGPSPQALAEAIGVVRESIERRFGVRIVPCSDSDPDALRLSAPDRGEPLGDVREAAAAERRGDLDAQ